MKTERRERPQAVAAAAPGGPARDWRAALRRYRYPLGVLVASRVGVYGIIAMQAWTSRRPRHAPPSFDALLRPLGEWDAQWYRWIADHAYDPAIAHGNTAAFFPLYPLTWRVAGWLSPGPMTLVGSLLSTALLAAALCLLYRMTLGRFDEPTARRTVLYLAIFPLAFVFSLPYAESLFLLLSLAAFSLTWHGRWWWGCVAGALAVLARPVGIALLPALAWRRYRERGLEPLAFLPLLLLPLAELGFFAYLAWRTGDPLAHFHAQERGWERGASVLPWLVGYDLVHFVYVEHQLRYLVHVAFTLLWCALFVKAWRMRLPGEYLVYAALLVVIPTTGGLLLSIGRFGMVGFPFFWALADLGRDERVDTLVKTLSPLLLAALVFVTYGPKTFTP